MLKTKWAAWIGMLMFAGNAFAKLEACPDLNAIQAEGVTMSMKIYGIYAAYQISNFNTDLTWGFVMAPIDAESDQETIDNANEILSEMNSPGVLIQDGICSYETGISDMIALAIQDDFPTPLKLRQYINK